MVFVLLACSNRLVAGIEPPSAPTSERGQIL
jgi:hypothetical protein